MNKLYPIQIQIVKTFIVFLGIFTSSLFVYAQPGAGAEAPNPLQNPLAGVNSFSDFMSSILEIVIAIGIPIAVLAIIYSGFLFVTAQGNEEKLKTAKMALLWSVVGTAILLGAWAISQAIGTTISALS